MTVASLHLPAGPRVPALRALTVAVAGTGAGLLAATDPLLGAGVAVALLLAAVSLLRPETVTVLVVGVLYSNAAVLAVELHGLPPLVAVAVFIALGVPLAHRLLVQRQPFVLPPALPLVVLFGALQAASAIAGGDMGTAGGEFAEFLLEGLGLFVLVTNTVVDPRTVRRAMWALLLVGALLGGLNLFQQVTGGFGNHFWGLAQLSDTTVSAGVEDGAGAPRLAGPIGEPNRYAQVLVVLIPLGLVQVVSGRSLRVRLAATGVTALITAGVVLTYSRGAAVGLGMILLLAAAMRVLKARWLLLTGAALAAGVVLVPAYARRLASLSAVTSAADPLAANRADGALQGRASENLAALLAMQDNPLLGVGPGGFPAVYQRYVSGLGVRPHEGEREAHNLYAGLGAELGILGLLCFLAVVAVVLRDLARARRVWQDADPERSVVATGFLLALVAYLATGTFLHLGYQRYFWLLLALAVSASSLRPAPGRPAGAPSPVPAMPVRTSVA
jgi:putative inorganic carbon (HCO3(-)) transporter